MSLNSLLPVNSGTLLLTKIIWEAVVHDPTPTVCVWEELARSSTIWVLSDNTPNPQLDYPTN